MESLRKALEEEAKLASVLREENTRALKEAIDILKEASLGCDLPKSCHFLPPLAENATQRLAARQKEGRVLRVRWS